MSAVDRSSAPSVSPPPEYTRPTSSAPSEMQKTSAATAPERGLSATFITSWYKCGDHARSPDPELRHRSGDPPGHLGRRRAGHEHERRSRDGRPPRGIGSRG